MVRSAKGGENRADVLIRLGPTIMVGIGFDPLFVPGSSAVPKSAAPTVQALVDTGASECCIDSGLAAQLGLPVINRIQVAGVTGVREANLHLAPIHCPDLKFTMYGQFAALDLVGGGQPHYALIGRTFLRHMTLIYDGKTGIVQMRH